MATIASLVVNIGADISDIVRNSDRAASSMEGFAAKATSAVKGLAAGWVITEVLDRTIQKFNELADKAQTIEHLARNLDISAEAAHRFSIASEGAGTNISTLAASMGRVESALASGGAKAVDTTAALTALGISARAFISVPADERAYAIAAAFEKMKDRTIEVKAATELFGKQSHEMIGLLNQDFIDAADGAAAWSTATILALKETGEAIEKLKLVGELMYASTFGKWLAEASELNTLMLGIGNVVGIGAGTAGMISPGELPEPKFSPDRFQPPGMPTIDTDAAIATMNEKLRIQEGINDELAQQQQERINNTHVELELWDRFRSLQDQVAAQVDRWTTILETRSVAAAERLTSAMVEAMIANDKIARDARGETARIEQGFNPAPAPDAVGAIIARADAEAAAVTAANQGLDLQSLGEATAAIYQRANAEIAAMQSGLQGVATATEAAGASAERLHGHYQRAAAVMMQVSSGSNYTGYVDDKGNPTTELRSSVLANMPANTRPGYGFEGGGTGGTTSIHNVTVNGAVGDRDALRRMIEELLMEQASQGRLRSGAR